VAWGTAGDIPVPGDYDNNGVTNIAVYRPSTGAWYIRGGIPSLALSPDQSFTWGGLPGDIPVAVDYDGDGATDAAIYRPSTGEWLVRNIPARSTTWGASTDIPTAGYYLP
jgi:hypothetical protein